MGLGYVNLAPTRCRQRRRAISIASSAGALAVESEPLQSTVCSMRNLTKLLLRHRTLDGDEDIHSHNPRVDAIIRHDVYVEVLELLLDRMHFRFTSPQTRELMSDNDAEVAMPRCLQQALISRTVRLVARS